MDNRNHKLYEMDFSKVYDLNDILQSECSYQIFFAHAPAMNDNRQLIKVVVCGIRVEDIEDKLVQEVHYLDKLVDELAKGKSMDKILSEN